jgi:hypothetical protein
MDDGSNLWCSVAKGDVPNTICTLLLPEFPTEPLLFGIATHTVESQKLKQKSFASVMLKFVGL